MKSILLLIFLFIFTNSFSQGKSHLLIITKNDTIIRKEIINSSKNITYFYEKGKIIDTVIRNKNGENNYDLRKVYNCDYQEDCEFTNNLNISQLKSLGYHLSDLCQITTSVSSSGIQIMKLLKTVRKSKNTIYIIAPINSKFNNLSLEVQSYFYNKLLYSLTVITSNNIVRCQNYIFENGVLEKKFIYHRNELLLDYYIKYNNGDQFTDRYIFQLSQIN